MKLNRAQLRKIISESFSPKGVFMPTVDQLPRNPKLNRVLKIEYNPDGSASLAVLDPQTGNLSAAVDPGFGMSYPAGSGFPTGMFIPDNIVAIAAYNDCTHISDEFLGGSALSLRGWRKEFRYTTGY